MGADDGLTAAGLEFAAQEDDLLGQQALNVARKVHGVEGRLRQKPIDERILFHALRLPSPECRDRTRGWCGRTLRPVGARSASPAETVTLATLGPSRGYE